MIDHNKRDKKSHVLEHSISSKHERVWKEDYKIIGKNYSSKTKRKISEAIFIKDLKPALNIQDSSYPLKLYR